MATGKNDADSVRSGPASGCTNAIASRWLAESGPPASSAGRGLAMPTARSRSALAKRVLTPFPHPIHPPPERNAASRRQSLKRISILAQGSHRRWRPWVRAPRKPNPEGTAYCVPQRTGFAEHNSWGRCNSNPEKPFVEFHSALPEDPSKQTSRSRESRPVPIEVDNPFRIGRAWGRKPQVSTCGGYLGPG